MQKLHEPCIKTGAFAKLCNTNKRTLFHYDEIGLFSPSYTDEKGYRFYSESQCDVFFTITCLREIGMPLKEIKKYIDHRTPAALKELLLTQYEKVQSELLRLKRTEQVIKTKLELVQTGALLSLQQTLSEITIEQTPEEYLLTSKRLDTNDHDVIMRTLCEHIGYCNYHELNAGHPYGAMLSTEALLQNLWDTYAYFFIKVSEKPIGHRYHVKPAGLYAVIYLKGNYYHADQAYLKLFDYLNRHQLTMDTFSYKEAILDEIAVSSVDDYVTKISVKIK